MVELKEGWGRGVELRTSEEALLSQVRLVATHMESFKFGSNRVPPWNGVGKMVESKEGWGRGE